MHDALTLLVALLAAVAGMGWFALSNEVHWRQVRGSTCPEVFMHRLRILGGLGITAALAFCLSVDSASIAVLVWLMVLAAAALTIAFTLTWRARALRVLVFWYW
ncbi:uncharacterized protein DUF3325 [Pseudoduganella lurida]|uniref:Uncharacterized protein DUF3325 n=1 Tax=Pseudoduganella lurida TaxID=1036180 RepID=A0A562RJ32_9BURK|nr:DUF3325 domain-containing protein [Pseudoduganella lurida]TWI69092.1 uncharacterized protein DUF3325 [Pseudoduganella lurida]